MTAQTQHSKGYAPVQTTFGSSSHSPARIGAFCLPPGLVSAAATFTPPGSDNVSHGYFPAQLRNVTFEGHGRGGEGGSHDAEVRVLRTAPPGSNLRHSRTHSSALGLAKGPQPDAGDSPRDRGPGKHPRRRTLSPSDEVVLATGGRQSGRIEQAHLAGQPGLAANPLRRVTPAQLYEATYKWDGSCRCGENDWLWEGWAGGFSVTCALCGWFECHHTVTGGRQTSEGLWTARGPKVAPPADCPSLTSTPQKRTDLAVGRATATAGVGVP